MKRILKGIFLVLFIIVVLFISALLVLYQTIIPKIKLKGKEVITLKLNEEYEEAGYTATILKRDYTSLVKVKSNLDNKKVGEYLITYELKSKYLKNKVKKKRIIKVIDDVLPELELKGKEKVTIYLNSNYKESGYVATDNYDGDITDKVIVTGEINNKKLGEYKLTYEVSDSSSNKVSKTRTIVVKKKPNVGTGPGIAILMYHYFYDGEVENGSDANWTEIHAFEEQIKYLKESGYYFPSWTEVANFIDGKANLPLKSVVITCDDGHKSFFKLAVPILEKYNVKATSFLVTGRSTVPSSNLISFQSHTDNMHRGGCKGGHGGIFRCIERESALNDLRSSINKLGSSDVLAYPFGDVTDEIEEITKEAGFKLAVTTNWGKARKGMDKYSLPRIRVSKGESLETFKKYL